MNKIIIKTFKTMNRFWVYDRQSNSIISVTEEEHNNLKRIEEEGFDRNDNPVLHNYQNQGIFQPNTVRRIKHSRTNDLEHLSNTRIYQLILQVTQQCNLRCEYCAFSGAYFANRQHSSKTMSFEIAKDAIDFFLARTKEQERVHIGFYGGEPLLEFKLIKQCVDYIKKLIEGKSYGFGLTTNGTLLTEQVVDYLIDNNFDISISLDGSKSEHDKNRKFLSGEGSFDKIMENVVSIKNRDLDFFLTKVSFLTVVNPKIDMKCTLDFFASDMIMRDTNIIFSSLQETGTDMTIRYDDKHQQTLRFEYLKMLFFLIGKLDKKYVSELTMASREQYTKTFMTLKKHSSLSSVAHHGGPCLPGIRRLFVTTDARLFPCEKVSDQNDYFCIGSLESGFNYQQMENIMNNGIITEAECIKCWCLPLCKICSDEVEFEGGNVLMKENKMRVCVREKNRIMIDLIESCVLREFGYIEDYLQGAIHE